MRSRAMRGFPLMLVLCATPSLAQPPVALELEAMRTFRVPAGFDVSGAILLPDSGLVGWGAAGIFVVDETGAPRLLDTELAFEPRGLRILKGPGPAFEVIGVRGEHAGVGKNAADPDRMELLAGFITLQAISVPDGWFVLVEPDGETAPSQQVCFFPDSQGPREEVGIPVVRPSPPWEHPVHLSPAGRDVLATEIAAPFRTWRLRTLPEHQPQEIAAEILHRDDLVVKEMAALGFPTERTAALPALRLDRGYLLQFSELSEDRRLVILIDDEGQVIRSSTIDVALGFMVSEPDTRLLLALRDIGMREFVLYRWTWGGRR